MKKNLLSLLIAVSIIISGFTSCQKDSIVSNQPLNAENINGPNDGNKLSKSLGTSTATASFLTYTTCNTVVKIYNPGGGMFTLGMTTGNTYKRFGMPGLTGTLDFQNIDYVAFEFSGLYADAANTVKLYRIRRTDGKYFTFYLAPGYDVKKLPGQGEEQQLWLFNDLGNSKYNLIAPKFGNGCFVARTYKDNNSVDKMGILALGQTPYSGSIAIDIRSAGFLSPPTK